MTDNTTMYDIQTIASIENMRIVANDIVTDYCKIHGVDETDIYPTVWADIIDELYIQLFKPCNRLLKVDGNEHNEYNKDKVLYVYQNIYRRLCNSHCQEITQKSFCAMSGIDKQTLYNWLSSSTFDLQQKIMSDNEESLFNLMKDRRNNPMKYLPKLNKVHHWNMPGVKVEKPAEALGADALIQLGQQPRPLELSDNSSNDYNDN